MGMKVLEGLAAKTKEELLKNIKKIRQGDMLNPSVGHAAQASDLLKYYGSGDVGDSGKAPMTDLDTYYGTDTLGQSYRAAQASLDAGKRTALQNAAVAYDTAQKYLPVQNKVNGLQGLGVSESASIDAYNKYVSSMGSIAQQHGADTAALMENYRSARQEEDALKRAELKEAQDVAYTEAVELLKAGTYNSMEDIDAYLNTVRGTVSDEQMKRLEYYANYLKGNSTVQSNLKTASVTSAPPKFVVPVETANLSLKYKNGLINNNGGISKGNNFSLTDNNTGEEYKVQSGGEAGYVYETSLEDYPEGLYKMDGKLFYKTKNGKVFQIEDRSSIVPTTGNLADLSALFDANKLAN